MTPKLTKRSLIVRILLALVLIGEPALGSSSPLTYQVEAGDVLNVDIALRGSLADLSKLSTGLPLKIVGESVYSHNSVTVTPDGYIFLPGLSPFKAQGLTLGEIEKAVATALRLPQKEHLVSVELVRTNSMAIHIWGEVKQPGRFLLDHPTSLMEAISYAGGPSERARMGKILWVRPGEPTRRIDLSSKSLKTAGGFSAGVLPGDTIVVPRKKTMSEFVVIALLTAISTASAVYVAAKN